MIEGIGVLITYLAGFEAAPISFGLCCQFVAVAFLNLRQACLGRRQAKEEQHEVNSMWCIFRDWRFASAGASHIPYWPDFCNLTNPTLCNLLHALW